MSGKTAKIQFLSREILKVLAMFFMILDHAYMTVVSQPGFQWMTMLGRLAFPIFAFQITEGYTYTSSKKKYILYMLLFACISEIPYNLMMGGEIMGLFHQNVMFTFLIALLLLCLLDKIFTSARHILLKVLLTAGVCLLGVVLGTLMFVDYSGFGVLTVLVFYIAKQLPRKSLTILFQLIGLGAINLVFLGGQVYILSNGLEIPTQGLALLSLPLIWCYNGRKVFSGITASVFKYASYLFYPAHILILVMVALYL